MKSFISYPFPVEKMVLSGLSQKSQCVDFKDHFQCFEKIRHMDGSIIKCGVEAAEDLDRLAIYNNANRVNSNKKIVTFEKAIKDRYLDNQNIEDAIPFYKIEKTLNNIGQRRKTQQQKEIDQEIMFIPGNPGESIPQYLIENPELKISFLNINLDDYDTTSTALQFFYPRIVHGGILLMDNYYKNEEEYLAVSDYFKFSDVVFNSFSDAKRSYFIMKK